MNHTCKVTESVFNAVKILLKGGAKNIECAEYMHISDSAVSLIKKSETYEEYKQICYTTSSAYRKKMAAIKAKEEAEKAAKEKEEKEKQEKLVAEKVGAVPATQMMKQEPPTQIVEHRQTIQITATHYMMEEMKKTNELLKIINNKLGAIIDDLYGTGGVKNDA